MKAKRFLSTTLGAAVVASSLGCGLLSSPPEQRDEYAAIGGVAGGATGAIIGALTGGAVAGGLFGIPIGAVAGYYIGDQMAGNQRSSRGRDDEMNRLRQENERFRRESSFQGGGSGDSAAMAANTSLSSEQIRQVQQRLNQMGYHSGNIDGIWGPETQSAVRNFQQSRDLQVTGQLNDQTARALGVEGAGIYSQSGSQPYQPSGQSGAAQQWQQSSGQSAPSQAGSQGSQNWQQPSNARNMQQSSGQSAPSQAGNQGSQNWQQPAAQGSAPQGQQSSAQQNQSGQTRSSDQAFGMGGSQSVMISQQELRQVQNKLNSMGYNAGHVDGVWGPRTQSALRNFQQSKNIPVTGRLNEQTLDALDIR